MTEHTQAAAPDNQNGAPPEEHHGGFNLKKKLIWMVLFVLIAAMSIWAVVSMNEDFSFAYILKFFREANPYWLIGALLGTLGFILFEGCALWRVGRAFGYKTKFRNGFFYSAADIYFSAITPSATGGQPASAYFMVRDGMSGMFSTVALLSNLVMYTLSGIILGLVCLPFHLDMLADFNPFAILLVVFGLLVQVGLMIFFVLLLTKKNMMHRICDWFLRVMIRFKMVKRAKKWQKKMDKWMNDYEHFSSMMQGKRKELLIMLLFNLLQKISQTMVTVCIFMAAGGSGNLMFDIFTVQIFVVLGATVVPIPGGMGVSDFILADGLRAAGAANASSLGLISRAFSFYLSVFICGIAFVVKYCLLHRKGGRNK